MAETKTTFKFFDIMAYEKEADYLGNMHADGWKFIDVTFPGFYHFEKCQPADYTYQLDYNLDGLKNKAEYKQMFADCGWEYLTDFVNYSYFRKPSAEMGQEEEGIFCDDESRLEMMSRIFKGRLVPLLVIFCLCILPNVGAAFGLPSLNDSKEVGMTFLVLFILYMAIFIRFAVSYFGFKRKLGK